jgi:hypothetical protein
VPRIVRRKAARESTAMLKGDHRGPTYATAGSSPFLAGVTGTQRLPLPSSPLFPA